MIVHSIHLHREIYGMRSCTMHACAGGEAASKTIRNDLQGKLAVLGMPYLWDPAHSTAQVRSNFTAHTQPPYIHFVANVRTYICACTISVVL